MYNYQFCPMGEGRHEPTKIIDVLHYIQFIRSTRKQPAHCTKALESIIGLPNEVGELLDIYKKYYRDNKQINRQELISEFGDVLYYLFDLMDLDGISPKEVIEYNIEKLTKRQNNK